MQRDLEIQVKKIFRDTVIKGYRDAWPVTRIQRFGIRTRRTSGIQGYKDTRIQRYRDIEVLGYRGTGIQRYRDTEVQGYRGTGIQRYRDTEIQGRVQRYRDTGPGTEV